MSMSFLVYVKVAFSVVLGVRVNFFSFSSLVSGLVSAFGDGFFALSFFFLIWGVFLLGVDHFLFLFG